MWSEVPDTAGSSFGLSLDFLSTQFCVYVCVFGKALATHSVDHAELKLRDLPTSASCMLALKAWTTTAWLVFKFFKLQFFLYVYCVHLWVHMPWHVYGGQKTSCSSWLSPSTMRITGIELRSSGMATSAFTHWDIFTDSPRPLYTLLSLLSVFSVDVGGSSFHVYWTLACF